MNLPGFAAAEAKATLRPSSVAVPRVISAGGPIAPPEMCNGLMMPVVAFDHMYSFDIDRLSGSIPKPEEMTAKQFAPSAEELFMRIVKMTDNAGATMSIVLSIIWQSTIPHLSRNC